MYNFIHDKDFSTLWPLAITPPADENKNDDVKESFI